jgi:hypothetical protein
MRGHDFGAEGDVVKAQHGFTPVYCLGFSSDHGHDSVFERLGVP